MALLGIPFEVIPSGIEEREDDAGDAGLMALRLAIQKAQDVAARAACAGGQAVVLGADTVVSVQKGGRCHILGKPADARQARAMLELLSGRTHEVSTAVAAVLVSASAAVEWAFAVTCSRVRFRRLEALEIEEYIATGEPFDKAGGYGIQGLGGRLVEAVQGDYTNVIGLPLATVRHLLLRWYPDLASVELPSDSAVRAALGGQRQGCSHST